MRILLALGVRLDGSQLLPPSFVSHPPTLFLWQFRDPALQFYWNNGYKHVKTQKEFRKSLSLSTSHAPDER